MDATVAILAGGLGTRISGVLGDTPKVLGPVAGRPFLEWLLDRLESQGAHHVIMLLGHLADKVESHLAEHPRPNMIIETVIEPEPLGTLGALRHAGGDLRLGDIILINGDTFVDVDIKALVRRHKEAGKPVTMLCVKVEDTARYGRVDLTEDGMVRRFFEKDPDTHGPGVVNAGVNVFSPRAIDLIQKSHGASLEQDFLEALPQNTIAAHVVDAAFVDIGTPESYAEAARIMGIEDTGETAPPQT
ncbi:MAG: nucleotidyltransferase family protein [Alphaproteobacteria bacterium]|nr:nucleotidyltransferase family protein [Alphaproteobacteria bacterium]